MAVGQNPAPPGEHQNRWQMDVHPPQSGAIDYAPWPNCVVWKVGAARINCKMPRSQNLTDASGVAFTLSLAFDHFLIPVVEGGRQKNVVTQRALRRVVERTASSASGRSARGH